MPQTAPQALYPIDQLNELKQSGNNSNKNKKSKYLAADLHANTLVQEKRKFVSLESSPNSDVLIVKKYCHKTFKDSSIQNDKNDKPINEKHLVLYVKGNEQKKCFSEMQQIVTDSFDLRLDNTLNKVRNHFEKVWINVKEFDNYGDMKRAFDEKTGEYIENSVNGLGKTYLEAEEKYQQLIAKGVVSGESKKILNQMQEILSKMKDIFDKNRSDFQHLSTNTVSSVAQSFEKLVSEFEEKIQQLEIEKSNAENNERIKVLENNTIKLQTDCKNSIPSGLTCIEEIFDERKEINNRIDFLLASICDLKKSNMTTFAVDGLEGKYNSLQNELLVFSNKINIPLVENVNNSEEEKLQQERMEEYFNEKIQPILENIQNHSEKTSPEKASILKEILNYFKNINEKITAKTYIEDINGIIEDIKKFIKDKIKVLVPSRGFFKSVSVGLVEDLSSKLDGLAPQTATSEQQNFASVRP